jgi:hypothetical protein
MSNIFFEYLDLDERKEVTLIHNGKIHQDTGQLFIMNSEGTKVRCLLFVFVFGCVLFVCKFMVFEVYNSMEMNFLSWFS